MSMKIRLARGGSKKRPHYSIVASDSRMPRDGRFIEKLGIYNPMLAKDAEGRIMMDLDKIKAWLAKGAQPTDRVARFLEAAGVIPKTVRNNPKAAVPGKAMAERAAGNLLERRKSRLDALAQHLAHLDPRGVLARGYSITRNAAGEIVRDAGSLPPGSAIRVELHQGSVDATVDRQND